MTTLFQRNRNAVLNMVLIDIHDYEGRLLLQKDAGIPLMPPAPLPDLDYDALKPSDMKRVDRNQRLAMEIYKRAKESLERRREHD